MSEQQVPCRSCGTQNAAGRDFCEKCGEYLSWAPTAFVAAVPVAGAGAEAISENTSVQSPDDGPTNVIGTRPDDAAPPTDDATPDSAVTPLPEPVPNEPVPAPPAPPPPPVADPVVGIPEGPPPTGDASIVLAPADPALGTAGVPAVEAGATLSFVATVRNESDIVDNYDLAVLGLPDSWAIVTPVAAFLVPLGSGRGESTQELRVDIAPPREYRSTAGIWTFELIALSRTTATVAARAIAQFEVKPFQAWSVEAVPVVNAGRLKARYRIAVRNDGNAEQDLWLIAITDSGRVRARFQTGRVTLQAGEVGVDVMTLRPRFPIPVGRTIEHRIGVDVLPTQPDAGPGELTVKEKLAAQAKEQGATAAKGVKLGPKGLTLPKLPRLPNPLKKFKGLDSSALARLRSPGEALAPLTARQVVLRQKPLVPLWLIALLVLVAIAAYVIYRLLPDKVGVPMLVGAKDSFVAEKTLRDRGLVLSQPPQRRVDADSEPGAVIAQSPSSGAKVDKGSSVSIVIADGATQVDVPRLKGLTRVSADRRLNKAGLVLGDTEPADAPDDFIVRSQIPGAGLSVERGSSVRVFLRKTPLTAKQKAQAKKKAAAAAAAAKKEKAKNAKVVIPPIDGMPATEYVAELKKLKLKPKLQSTIASAAAGKVLSVDPQPGEKATVGDEVTVRASSGSPSLAVETDGLVLIVDPANGKELGRLPEGDEGPVAQLSYVPGGERVVFRSDNKLVLADADGKHPRAVYAGPDVLEHPTVAPDANTVAVIRREEGDGDLCFGRLEGREIRHLCLPDDGWNLTGRISWRADGRAVLVAGRLSDHPSVFGIREFSTTGAGPIPTDPTRWKRRTVSDTSTPGKGVLAAAFSPDGERLAAVSNSDSKEFVVVIGLATDVELVEAKRTRVLACDLAWRPDGKELAVVEADETCTEPLGKIMRFGTATTRKSSLVTEEGRNPVYRSVK